MRSPGDSGRTLMVCSRVRFRFFVFDRLPQRNKFGTVIPSQVSSDWTLISRLIVAVVDQHIPFIGDGSQSGIGEITGEFFFVPSKPGLGGIL